MRKPYKLPFFKNSFSKYHFIPLTKEGFYLQKNLSYISLENTHTLSLPVEFSEFFRVLGLVTGTKISWFKILTCGSKKNSLLTSIRIYGPAAFLNTLKEPLITLFSQYETLVRFWAKKHFYRRMVKLRTNGKTWGNLPKRKEFISIKVKNFIKSYTNFLIKKLERPKTLLRSDIDINILDYIDKYHYKRITRRTTLKKEKIINNRFIV